MGRLGMVPGLPKWAKKACLRRFFAVAMQPEDQGTQSLRESFLGLIISSKPYLSFMGRLEMVPGSTKWAKKACLRQFFTVEAQQDDLGPQNFLESFLGLIMSSKPNLCFKGRLGMVPGPPK